MPLYAYRCKNCDHVFEKRQRMTEEPLKECPACAGEVRRLISNVGIVFKGSGFYVTDNRNGEAKNKKNGSAKSEESKSESSDSKSEKSASDTPASTTSKASDTSKGSESKSSASTTSTAV